MRKNLLFLFFWVSVFLLGGCVTQSIKHGKDLSSSGIAYTAAVNNLLDVTVDRVIDFDTAELMKSRLGSKPRERIIQKNQAVLEFVSEIDNFRCQTNLLRIYFLNLQALAESPVKDDAGNSVQALADSISKLNTELAKDKKGSLTDEQEKQIGALGGLVANSIHAAKIKKALKRDAKIIGTYLCYQENQLNIIASTLEDRFRAENDLFLNDKIIAPYVDANQALGESWAINRKQWFKTRFTMQQLATAQEAAKQLLAVWADILQGRTDLNSLSVLISDVNEFVTASQALKEASDSK